MPSCFKPAGFDPVRDALRFHVVPRYTVGSQGMVRSEIASERAKAERRAYEEAISLSTNPKYDTAKRLGLSGIVEERWEFRGRTHFRDLITGEVGYLDAAGKRGTVYGKMPTTFGEG